MNRKLIAAAVTAAALAGCHTMPCHGPEQSPVPTRPQVSIVDGRHIVVNQEPIIFTKAQVNVTIRWQLPANGEYRFPRNGIDFEKSADGEIVECQPSKDGLEFTCLNRHTRPGSYKYTVNVQRGEKRLEPLDPRVVNM